MRQTSKATLFYGITFTEEEQPGWFPWYKEGMEHDEWVAKKLGICEPKEPYVSRTNHVAYREYWGKLKKIRKDITCVIVTHGSQYDPMYSIGVRESIKVVYGHDSMEIDFNSIHIKTSWITQLKDFCEEAGVEYTDPKWWMVSCYH